MQLLIRQAICNFFTDSNYFFFINFLKICIESSTPFNPWRISNNLYKEFIMMMKFTTIYVQLQRIFVFKDSQLSYFMRLCICQIIVLVSVLPEFAKQSWLLCRMSVDFVLRPLNMVSAFEIIS